jgi:predicted RNA binding protein YcfA (HicA-like mRNA interferase family)
VSVWPSTRARKVLQALERIGWRQLEGRTSGSHRQLVRNAGERFTWAFHDGEEIGPRMLARIAKATGLRPEDL